MTLLDQILDALKNPSADHAAIYAGLAVIVAVIGFIVFSAMKPKKEELIMTLDEVVESPSKPSADEKDDYHKIIDKNGPYEKEMNGTLTPEAFLKLRRVIMTRAYEKYKPRKIELMEERIGYY